MEMISLFTGFAVGVIVTVILTILYEKEINGP